MKSLRTSRAVAILGLSVFAVAAWAGDAEAEKWIEKLAGIYEKAPYSADIEMDMSMSMGEMKMDMKMEGVHCFGGPLHQRMNMKTSINVPGQAEMVMDMLMVHDGAVMWMEMKGGQIGEMYMKMSLETMQELIDSGAPQAQQFANLANMSASEMIEKMKEFMNFEFAGEQDGRVTLRADVTPEGAKAMNLASNPAMDLTDMKLELSMDAVDIMPMGVKMFLNDVEIMTMRYDNFKKLTQEEVDAQGLFSYQPPEGVTVMDMERMLQPQQEQ